MRGSLAANLRAAVKWRRAPSKSCVRQAQTPSRLNRATCVLRPTPVTAAIGRSSSSASVQLQRSISVLALTTTLST